MICSIVFIELDFSNCGPISGRDVDVHGPLGGRAQVEGPDAGDDALRHEHASFHLQVWLHLLMLVFTSGSAANLGCGRVIEAIKKLSLA